MPKAAGLMSPENAVKGAGAFKEGFIRIDSNSYKVHQAKGEDAVPATKWVWQVTRLNESGEEPLVDEHDEPIREELAFSFGGKCLPFIHPARADGPDDEEPEDMGTEVGAEGNTLYLNAPDWRPNERSGVIILTASMQKAGVKSEYLKRCWTPDWNGCVFEMRQSAPEKGRDGREFSYKICSKVLVGPGGKAKAAGAGSKVNSGAKAGGSSDLEPLLTGVIMGLSQEMDGQQVTKKAFVNRVRAALDEKKVDSKLIVPALTLVKNDIWLKERAGLLDISVSENAILFGRLEA
jgi:hypothetical protein